jgi:hypothetical protein
MPAPTGGLAHPTLRFPPRTQDPKDIAYYQEQLYTYINSHVVTKAAPAVVDALVDEVGNTLTFRVRFKDGVTMKSVVLPLT